MAKDTVNCGGIHHHKQQKGTNVHYTLTLTSRNGKEYPVRGRFSSYAKVNDCAKAWLKDGNVAWATTWAHYGNGRAVIVAEKRA